MFKKMLSILVLTGAVLTFFTNTAYANIGLPMVFLGVPFLVLAFIPVWIIEMYIYYKALNISLKKSGIDTFGANVITTIIGYPISWGLHVLVGMAVGYPMGYVFSKFHNIDWLGYALFPLISAWLMPGVDQWQMYLAGFFGLIPAFWLSVKLEGMFLQKRFKECEAEKVKKAVWKANKTTYLILATFLGMMSFYHGLIKLHAFDFLRDKSNEQVVFQQEIKGNILVSSDENVYSLDPTTREIKKVVQGKLKEIRGKRSENQALSKEQVWFTTTEFENGRQETLYRYDIESRRLTKISSWKNINQITIVHDGAYVFSGDSYYSKNDDRNEDGVFKVSTNGKVQKVFNDGLSESQEYGVISSLGSKIAELRMVEATALNVIRESPYLVHAELRVYDFETKENIKIDDLWGIFRFKNVDNFNVSWHPTKNILYYSNAKFLGSADGLSKQINLSDLKQRYKSDVPPFDSAEMPSLLKEINLKVKAGGYAYNFDTKAVKKFTDNIGILGWHPAGELVLIKKGVDEFELVNLETGKVQNLEFKHLKSGKTPVLTWSEDGEFIAYLGDSEHFLDKHHYQSGMRWRDRPGWVWIKEVATGKERQFRTKPINLANDILWVED